jgi:hypothetical protein
VGSLTVSHCRDVFFIQLTLFASTTRRCFMSSFRVGFVTRQNERFFVKKSFPSIFFNVEPSFEGTSDLQLEVTVVNRLDAYWSSFAGFVILPPHGNYEFPVCYYKA